MSGLITNASIADRIESELPGRVGPARLAHIQGVAATLDGMAVRFGVDRDRARLVAVAHDMDRELGDEELQEYCAKHELAITEYERARPVLLHGPVAADRLEREYGLYDRELVKAVRHHTLGEESLGQLGLLLFASDFLEPGRQTLSEEERLAILSESSAEQIVARVIATAYRVYGRLAEPTKRLYARLTKELGLESTF